MLEDIRRGADAPAYQPQGGPGGRPQMDMSNLRMDQHPPRVLGAPAQSYPPGPVTACDTCHDLRRSPQSQHIFDFAQMSAAVRKLS